MTVRQSIPDFTFANAMYVGARVSFFQVDAFGVKTATLAALFDSQSGAGTLLNPQVMDSDGKFAAPVYVDVPVIGEVTLSNGVADHDTGVIGSVYIAATVSAFMQTMLDDASAAVARATLGSTTVGDAVFIAASTAAARTALGLGSAALLTAGVAANNAVQLDGTAKLPAVDGSALTGINIVPAGTVIHVAMNAAPAGYLKANGATVSRTTYAALFAAIGTTFGVGDGSTTFGIPDLRGYFTRGWVDNGTVDLGRAFGSTQTDAFQGHFHGGVQKDNGASLAGGAGGIQTITGNTTAAVTDGTNGTPRTAAETRPSNVALLACIKF